MSPYYNPMLAKMIAWAPTREAAIEWLDRGLRFAAVDWHHTVDFLRRE